MASEQDQGPGDDKPVGQWRDRRSGKRGVVDLALARRVWGLVSKGLTEGIGDPEPGQMCVEHAVCYALGITNRDDPPCVGEKVRAVKISLNDASEWPSDKARGLGMRDVAIAQLGSNQINQRQFTAVLGRLLLARAVPFAIRHQDNAGRTKETRDRIITKERERIAKLIEKEGLTPKVRKEIAAASSGMYSDVFPRDLFRRHLYTGERLASKDFRMAPRYALIGSPLHPDPVVPLVDNVLVIEDEHCHRYLKIIAGCILDALRECKSPGVALLDQIKEAKKSKKRRTPK